MLLHYGGEDLGDIFDTLPNTGEDDDYKAAIDALNSRFSRATSSEFSIYCFRQAKQQQDESLDTYHTRLQFDEHDFNAIENTPRLKRDSTTIKAYGTDTLLRLLGKFTAEVESKTKITAANFHAVSGNTGSLLSYQTARDLGLIQIASIPLVHDHLLLILLYTAKRRL